MNLRKLSRKGLVLLLLVILTAGILTACNSNKNELFEANEFAMGTVISQKVYGAKGQAAMDEVTEKMKYLDELLTFNAPEGDVYKLNENAAIKNVELNPETVKIIKKAQRISELSNGAFDVTIGPLVKSWGIGMNQEHIPTSEELEKLLPLVNYKDIYVDESSAGLKRAGQMIDLGGIAKGYAGDVAMEIYKKYDIKSAFVNIGGNVVTLGNKLDGSPWAVGIRNPRPEGNQSGQIVGTVKVTGKAVVTSGDEQRFFEKEGQRYHHILDPHTGYPAKSDLMSVTLIMDSSLDADALGTAVFVFGLEKGKELIQKYGGVEAVFITTDKKIYITEGIKGKFELHDESNKFQYGE